MMSRDESLETLSEQRCHGGIQGFYRHPSAELGGNAQFSVYVPPQARSRPLPVLYFLAGLTCTEETATVKAGAQRHAREAAIILVMPDTSPRGAGVPGEDDDWDFGTGAGFYLDATEAPWSKHYRMYSYITGELRALIESNFPVRPGAAGVCGHSMGGHGALTIALKNPDRYPSVSAFAPICAPTHCPWGEKAFGRYLGPGREAWAGYDATELVAQGPSPHRILIDQGSEDQFLAEQLQPKRFRDACERVGQDLDLRMQPGYDHSYYFIQSFIGDHIAHHAEILSG